MRDGRPASARLHNRKQAEGNPESLNIGTWTHHPEPLDHPDNLCSCGALANTGCLNPNWAMEPIGPVVGTDWLIARLGLGCRQQQCYMHTRVGDVFVEWPCPCPPPLPRRPWVAYQVAPSALKQPPPPKRARLIASTDITRPLVLAGAHESLSPTRTRRVGYVSACTCLFAIRILSRPPLPPQHPNTPASITPTPVPLPLSFLESVHRQHPPTLLQ